MIKINILVITGQKSYSIIEKLVKQLKEHSIRVEQAPVSVSAFLTEDMTKTILNNVSLSEIDLILIPGFVQWDTSKLERKFSKSIRKGPEFASDLPTILKYINKIPLSNTIPANKLFESSGEEAYKQIVKEQLEIAKTEIGQCTFYINKNISDVMIGRNLPPPIIAEIANCTEKSDKHIIKKVMHYIESGADVIDIGCVANKPNPEKVKRILKLLRENFNVLISVDSMDKSEIMFAVEEGVDMILSLDFGNYKDLLNLPKDIPIVILPTNVKEGIFPKDPETRVKNLFALTNILTQHGFQKIIADPLLETPISPGLCNSLETYFLYKKQLSTERYKEFELPLFFGISNVVELMDVDSVGINGLLASIAIELNLGILFTVEHSTKLMGGVAELKECVKLNYLSKHKNTPPINQGIQIFRAKGKTSQIKAKIEEKKAIIVKDSNSTYVPDESGYFKIYINHYARKIYILFFSNNDELLQTLIGSNAEDLSKKVIELNLTHDFYHLNYLGRELAKAETYLLSGKPYIQDD